MDVEDRIIINVNITQKKITGFEMGAVDPLSALSILLMQAAQIAGSIHVEASPEEKKVEEPKKGIILPRHLVEGK